MFAYLLFAPFMWFIVPLIQVIAELPLAVSRSFFSSTRWVEATCQGPSEIVIVWETEREHADEVADHVARTLPLGYERLTPAHAELVSMTEPPGLDDRAR